MQFKNILVPVDFSASSQGAVELASTLANQKGSTLHFVYVESDMTVFEGGHTSYVPTAEDIEQDRERLEKLVPAKEGVQFERHFLQGVPAEKIVEFAEQNGIDLIVLGSHGRAGLARFLLGSVAEQVVRTGTCPVLTVKQPIHLKEEAT